MAIGVTIAGFSGTVAAVGGTTFRALKVTTSPIDYGSLGAYRKSLLSGSIPAGLGAASEIFQFRWTSTAAIALITHVILDGISHTTAFAAGSMNYLLLRVARGWTVDGSGGTAGTITGNNGKLRTSMATTSVGSIRVISTTALGVGTKTPDNGNVGCFQSNPGVAANAIAAGRLPLFVDDAGRGPIPLIFGVNEGMVVTASVGATGVWQTGFTVGWTEVVSY